MIKKYIIQPKYPTVFPYGDGDRGVGIDVNYVGIINKEFLLNQTPSDPKFFPDETVFTPLFPYGGISSEFNDSIIFDYYFGLGLKGTMPVISEHFFNVLYPFTEKMPSHKFYKAQLYFRKTLMPYFVLQTDGTALFDSLIDFEKSSFVDRRKERKKDKEIIQVKNLEQLEKVVIEKKWRRWVFQETYMKPEFNDIDLIKTRSGLLFSEKLKIILEEHNLKGIKFVESKIEFKTA